MKLEELGLHTKPATKYFAGGYVSFWTSNKELHYQIYIWKENKNHSLLEEDIVRDQEHFKKLLAIKSVKEAVNQ